MAKKIIILASAIDNETGGAFVILDQFMHAVCNNADIESAVLISPAVLNGLDQSKYVQIPINHNRKWIKRFAFEFFFGITRYRQKDELLISFQNTLPITFRKDAKRVVYLHQLLPFSDKFRVNPFKKNQFVIFLKKYFYLFVIRIGLREQDEIIVQTNWTRQAVIKKLKHPAERVITMTPAYLFDSKKYPAKLEAPKSFNLFFPANYYLHKNHTRLLEALALAVQTNPGIRLHLTLTGNEADLYEQISRLGLNRNVIFVGFLRKDDFLSYFDKIDALIFPSVLETLGLPLLEAAHFNIPIMASDLPYAREVLENYRNVDFFDPYDPQSIAKSILGLHDRPFYTSKFDSSGVSWDDFVKRLLS